MYGLGRAFMDRREMIAGSSGVWTMVYETGEYGIDDSGEILIARRDVCDSAIPQFEDPRGEGYVRVTTAAHVRLVVRYVPDRYIRPWKGCISIRVADGSLGPGDRVVIRYGAGEGEGPGYRMQTFREDRHIFMVLVDCAGSGNFYELDESPSMRVTGGYMDRVEAVAPSFVPEGQPFGLRVRALDSWGNIAEKCGDCFQLRWDGGMYEVRLTEGLGWADDVSVRGPGAHRIVILDRQGREVGRSNPIRCGDENDGRLFWGDMHGQTGETVGTGTLDQYFTFARDMSFLDFSAWQGNDFQVTDETWQNVCRKVKQYHTPGRFVTFLGYEWSGTTPVGGDHNIYYLNDDEPIYRSYHWQIGPNPGGESDRTPIGELWKQFRGRRDVMAIPHVGGRYGNLDCCDEELVRLLEIHSHHGTFEWFYEDALRRGLRLGIVAASDDHTCRPGLSSPTPVTSRGGFVSFDVMGGYTAVYARELTRESLWEALQSRHCYGTTGQRILLDVRCGGRMMGDEFTVEGPPVIEVRASGQDVIADVEIRRGLNTVYRYSDMLPVKDDTIVLQWSGVRVKSRGKKTNWDGRLTVLNGSIRDVRPYAFNQPDEGASRISNQIIEWKSNTSGDIDGMEIELSWTDETRLVFSTEPLCFSVEVRELRQGRIVRDAGGVNRRVEMGFAADAREKDVEFVFTDGDCIKDAVNPYWVKVTQRNGHMAWSSPLFIRCGGKKGCAP